MTSTNDGKEVKSNQTSGPKGKTYYIELYKSLEAGLSGDCELRERTQHLCEAWRRIYSLCQHSAPSTHPHLLSWLQRHTARTVLQTEWQSPKSKDEHKSLEEAINAFVKECETRSGTSREAGPPPWETQLLARGEWFKRILANPWGHAVLRVLLDPRGEPPSDQEVLEWLKEERGVMFVTRLRQLAASKCEDLALSLSSSVMDRVRASSEMTSDTDADLPADVKDKPKTEKKPTFEDILKTEAGFTVDVWELLIDIEFVLLHKRDKRARCIELAKQTPLRNGYQLVERLQSRLDTSPREKKLWKNAKEVATLIAQVVITRCMVVPVCSGASRTALYCCARSLVRVLGPRAPPAARALAAPAATARHLHTLAAAVEAQSTPDLKPFVCELYVRAITAGMNELERLKLKTEKEAEARSAEQTLSSWFTQLGALLSASERIRCECTLTAFSMHPTPAMYERIKAAPPLPPLALDINELKEEPKSEFGSWANDSRSQTNFVKTSETLNLKHTQHQANVLSTAIFSEGETLGISPELCQDIAVLLSGPRLKTLSWDTDREHLLEKCRAYMERTNFGTRSVTTELKYLNLDPRHYQHLPEEEEDDTDMYYGIEKGYEHHLAESQEPEEIWQDADDPERTDSANSSEFEQEIIRKPKKTHKKTKKILSSEEDSDPLSLVAEAKRERVEKKKERPHSKERSKETKRTKSKTKPKDPLEIGDSSEKKKESKKKEKRERKRKEKSEPSEAGRSSLSSLIGMKVTKVGPKRPDLALKTPSASDSDYDSQGKCSLNSVLSEGNETDVLFDGLFSMDELKSPERSPDKMGPLINNEPEVDKGVVAVSSQSEINRSDTQGRNDSPVYRVENMTKSRTSSPRNQNNLFVPSKVVKINEDVKKGISKLIHFRRQKTLSESEQKIQLQPNVMHTCSYQPGSDKPIITPQYTASSQVSPKPFNVPDSPKVFINKTQSEQLAELKNEVSSLLSSKTFGIARPVIQYSPKSNNSSRQHSPGSGIRPPNPNPSGVLLQDTYKIPQLKLNQTAGSVEGSNVSKKIQSQTPNRQNFHVFLKELQESINAGAGVDTQKVTVKKEIKPISRVTPVRPAVKAETKTYPQCAKQSQKKSDNLNTFSRLSYLHKNKMDLKFKQISDSLIEYQSRALEKKTPPGCFDFEGLNRMISEHKNMKLKNHQSKCNSLTSRSEALVHQSQDNKSLLKKFENTKFATSARENPVIANILSNTSVKSEDQYKRVREVSSVTNKLTSLTEKDQQDLLLLLRQQSKLNTPQVKVENVKERTRPSQTITGNMTPTSNFSVPCTSQSTNKNKIVSTPSAVHNNNKHNSKSSQSAKSPNVNQNHVRMPQSTALNTVKTELKCNKAVDPNIQKIQILNDVVIKSNKHKSASAPKSNTEKESTDWEEVMDAILSHKTPSRGPKALDVALNKDSFNTASSDSLRTQRLVWTSSTGDSLKTNDQSKRLNNPRDTHTSTVMCRSKSENVIKTNKNKIAKQPAKMVQKPHTNKTTVLHANPNVTKPIQPETPKRHIQTEKRSSLMKDHVDVLKKIPNKHDEKQFTCSFYKEEDPFISGIPNSDYDLLEELMDDDLRQEIGELSSDEDSYAASMESLKDKKNCIISKPITPMIKEEKRLQPSVINTTPRHKKPKVKYDITKPAFEPSMQIQGQSGFANMKSVIKSAEYNSIDNASVYPTNVGQPTNVVQQTTVVQSTKAVQPVKIVQPINVSHQLSKTVITPPTKSNVQKQSFNINTNQLLHADQDNSFVAKIPQQTALNNVVLFGSDIVYQPCTVQTQIRAATVTQNTYMAFNNQPNMAIYQTTQYAAPVVNPLIIGNAITVPISKTPVKEMSTIVNHSELDEYNIHTPTNPQETKNKVIQMNTDKLDSYDVKSEPKSSLVKTPNEDVTPKSEKETIDINSNKNCERKVLSEVQEKQKHAFAEKADSKIAKSQLKNSIQRDVKSETLKDQERLKNKRLAILNRDICHRSDKEAIPLTYAPLNTVKVDTNLVKEKHTKELVDIASECKNVIETSCSKLELLVNTKIIHVDEIVETKGIDKTENLSNENCKENKDSGRRILLRSSNKLDEVHWEVVKKIPVPKKTKVKLKRPIDAAIKCAEGEKVMKVKGKPVARPKLNKTIKKVEKKRSKNQPKRNVKAKTTCDSKTELNPDVAKTGVEMSDYLMDLEDKIIVSKIPKTMTFGQSLIPEVDQIQENGVKDHTMKELNSDNCSRILENHDSLKLLLGKESFENTKTDASAQDIIMKNKNAETSKKDDIAEKRIENHDKPVIPENTDIVQEIDNDIKTLENLNTHKIPDTAVNELCSDLDIKKGTYNSKNTKNGCEPSFPSHKRPITKVVVPVFQNKINDKKLGKTDDKLDEPDVICLDGDDEEKLNSNKNKEICKESKNREVLNEDFGIPSQENNKNTIIDKLPQSMLDDIQIEDLPHLNTGDPTKKYVRIKLPSGRVFKATVHGQMNINTETLFSDPALKSVLLSNISKRKRYTLNIKQMSTSSKSNPEKVLESRIQEIHLASNPPTSLASGAMETIDLLSDSDEEGTNQYFNTEYGKYNILPMKRKIYEKHQRVFHKKCVVKLKRKDSLTNCNIPKKDNEVETSARDLAEITSNVPLILDDTKEIENFTESVQNNVQSMERVDNTDIQSAVQPVIQPTGELVAESSIQPAKEPMIQRHIQSVGEQSLQPVLQPNIQTVQRDIKSVVEPVLQSIVKTVAEASVQPIMQPTAQSNIQFVVQPDMQPVMQPIQEPVIDSVIQPLIHPIVTPVVETDIQRVAQPVIQDVLKPVRRAIVRDIPQNQPMDQRTKVNKPIMKLSRNEVDVIEIDDSSNDESSLIIPDFTKNMTPVKIPFVEQITDLKTAPENITALIPVENTIEPKQVEEKINEFKNLLFKDLGIEDIAENSTHSEEFAESPLHIIDENSITSDSVPCIPTPPECFVKLSKCDDLLRRYESLKLLKKCFVKLVRCDENNQNSTKALTEKLEDEYINPDEIIDIHDTSFESGTEVQPLFRCGSFSILTDYKLFENLQSVDQIVRSTSPVMEAYETIATLCGGCKNIVETKSCEKLTCETEWFLTKSIFHLLHKNMPTQDQDYENEKIFKIAEMQDVSSSTGCHKLSSHSNTSCGIESIKTTHLAPLTSLVLNFLQSNPIVEQLISARSKTKGMNRFVPSLKRKSLDLIRTDNKLPKICEQSRPQPCGDVFVNEHLPAEKLDLKNAIFMRDTATDLKTIQDKCYNDTEESSVLEDYFTLQAVENVISAADSTSSDDIIKNVASIPTVDSLDEVQTEVINNTDSQTLFESECTSSSANSVIEMESISISEADLETESGSFSILTEADSTQTEFYINNDKRQFEINTATVLNMTKGITDSISETANIVPKLVNIDEDTNKIAAVKDLDKNNTMDKVDVENTSEDDHIITVVTDLDLNTMFTEKQEYKDDYVTSMQTEFYIDNDKRQFEIDAATVLDVTEGITDNISETANIVPKLVNIDEDTNKIAAVKDLDKNNTMDKVDVENTSEDDHIITVVTDLDLNNMFTKKQESKDDCNVNVMVARITENIAVNDCKELNTNQEELEMENVGTKDSESVGEDCDIITVVTDLDVNTMFCKKQSENIGLNYDDTPKVIKTVEESNSQMIVKDTQPTYTEKTNVSEGNDKVTDCDMKNSGEHFVNNVYCDAKSEDDGMVIKQICYEGSEDIREDKNELPEMDMEILNRKDVENILSTEAYKKSEITNLTAFDKHSEKIPNVTDLEVEVICEEVAEDVVQEAVNMSDEGNHNLKNRCADQIENISCDVVTVIQVVDFDKEKMSEEIGNNFEEDVDHTAYSNVKHMAIIGGKKTDIAAILNDEDESRLPIGDTNNLQPNKFAIREDGVLKTVDHNQDNDSEKGEIHVNDVERVHIFTMDPKLKNIDNKDGVSETYKNSIVPLVSDISDHDNNKTKLLDHEYSRNDPDVTREDLNQDDVKNTFQATHKHEEMSSVHDINSYEDPLSDKKSDLVEEVVDMHSDVEILDDDLAQTVLTGLTYPVNDVPVEEPMLHINKEPTKAKSQQFEAIQKSDAILSILENKDLHDENDVPIIKVIEYEDENMGKCYVIPVLADSCKDDGDEKPEDITQQVEENRIIEDIDLKLNTPNITYSKFYTNKYHKRNRKNLKRKADMIDIKFGSERKYRKGKNIDYPKITTATMGDSAYSKEFKRLLDYCSSVKFSYSRPFHKECIDVHYLLKSWPIKGTCPEKETETEKDQTLFTNAEKEINNICDPLKQTLAEEIVAEYKESDYSSSDVIESNFKMGFGEGSGRVIQNLEDGCGIKFSAATLSDVKRTQPLLLSENDGNCNPVYNQNLISNDDTVKIQRSIKCIELKNKVRSFFKQTMAELSYDSLKQQEKSINPTSKSLFDDSGFPYGLCDLDFIQPPPFEAIVQVVQVGQLPVSAAAQNPVTCDPRVTQVSDVSPSQCSAENSPSDDPQSVIKTEYTELTTADLSMPLAHEYVQHIQSMPISTHEAMNYPMSSENYNIDDDIKPEIKIEMEETPEIKEEINDNYENNDYPPLFEKNIMNNVDYSYENNSSHMVPEVNSNMGMIYSYAEKQPVPEPYPHLKIPQQEHLQQLQQQEQLQQQQDQLRQQQEQLQQQQEQLQQQQEQQQQLLQQQAQQQLQVQQLQEQQLQEQQLQEQQQQEQYQQLQQQLEQEQQQQRQYQQQQKQLQQQQLEKEQQELQELQQQQLKQQEQQQLKQQEQQQLKQQEQQHLKQQQEQQQLKQQEQQQLKQQKQQQLKQQEQQQLKQQELKLKQQKQQELKQQQRELKQQQQRELKQQQLKQQQQKQQELKQQQERKRQLQQQQQQQQKQQKQLKELQNQQQQKQQQKQQQQQLKQQQQQLKQQQKQQQREQPQQLLQQQQQQQQQNLSQDKTDQIANAMNAAGISAAAESLNNTRAQALVNMLSQKLRQGTVGTGQANSNNYQKTTAINAMALQQALAQILPPPLNQTNGTENNQQNSNSQVTPQVLHIVQGKSASGNQQITLVDNTQQSVINTANSTPVLHIVQNKTTPPGPASNGTPAPQTNSFSGLSLVDGTLQQGNQLLHIVNAGNQKNANAGQLLKRVNLLTNLTNAQGGNEQKMVQFLCKSADGKAIQLNGPHQRSMVLRLQPVETPNLQPTQTKPSETQDLSPTHSSANNISSKDAAEIKSRSVYEENYAKFIQNSSPKTTAPEKGTSLPKFNQAFGKQGYQDGGQKNEISNSNSHLSPNGENSDCQPNDNAMNLDHISRIGSPPLLLRKPQTSQAQTNLAQQLKQTISPMNIHSGVIYTRQIPVNIGGGQTINLITVPSTELMDDANQTKQHSEIEPSIIKIVPQTQTSSNSDTTDENNSHIGATNDSTHTSQPQQVLTQMRIKLPMLSKAPQMVSGGRVVRPSFFQIQRNVIGGANQPVYQQLVLTAAPPLGQQTIRLPQAQTSRPVKTPSESQSSTESMSSSTLEQLREFDLVLEQVKERSTVQPNAISKTAFPKKHTPSTDTADSPASSSSAPTKPSHSQPAPHKQHQVLYSIGNTQPLNVAYVNRKAAAPTPSTSTYVRSPDSSGIVDSPPSSSTQAQIPHTVTSEPTPSTSETPSQTKPSKSSSKSKSRPKASSNPPNTLKLNTVPPKTSTQKPAEDEQTTQRILYILAEYKEQVENSPDKDKPAPRRRTNPPSNPGSSKRKKSSSYRRRDISPIDDSCRTMGSEDSSCGTSQGDCNESCIDSHSPQDSPRKVSRKLTFEPETPVVRPRPQQQRNVIVADGQRIAVARSTTHGKPSTAVLMPANYILPVSMIKGGQQIAIVTNRGPKLLTVGGGEGGATNALLLQRLIGPAGLKPVLTRPGVRHVRLPTAALHNLQAFNLASSTNVQPPDSTASPAPARTPPDLIETRANSSPWRDREAQEVKPERGSSPEGSEPWHLPASANPHDYSYEEVVRTDNMDRTVLDPIPDRYSPDMEAQRIFDKMFDVDSKKSYMVGSQDDSPRCGYDIDASDCDDKAYHQVVQKKDGSHHRQHRLTHVSAAALRHKYAILEHELRLQKSLSEECEDLGVDSPSASDLFPEAELLFAASPAHDHTQDQGHHSHTPQPIFHHTISQPDLDDQIATDQLLPRPDMHDDRSDLGIGLEDVGIVTVSEDGMQATIALDQEEFARSHPNTTFHSEPTDVAEAHPFTISGLKNRHITSTIYHSNRTPGTVLMTAPQTTVISQATAEGSSVQNPVKYADIDNMINSMPHTHTHTHTNNINLSSVLVKDAGLTRFESILNDNRELHLSNTASAIVHATANNTTQVIRRVCYGNKREQASRFLMDESDGIMAYHAKMTAEDSRGFGDDDDRSSPERTELFWESNSASERESRRQLDFSSDSDKCCKSPSFEENNSTDSSGIGAHMRLDSVIKEARGVDRRHSVDGCSADDAHAPPLRTYPAARTQHAPRSLTGKTRAGERPGGGQRPAPPPHPHPHEARRRASGRGVVKRGCHCCNGEAAPPRPKKPRQRKPNLDFSTN